MLIQIKKGSTSRRIPLFLQDSSKSDGSGLTGLTSGSAGLVASAWREDDGNAGASVITLAAGTRGTYVNQGAAGTGGGFVEKDSSNEPGGYEFSVPDAKLAAGSNWLTLWFKGATNLAPCPVFIHLTDYDPQDGTKLGLTGLPTDPLLNAVPGSYANGTAGYALGFVNTIYALLAAQPALLVSSNQPQPWAFAQFEAVTPLVVMSPPTNIGGWTFSLNVRQNGQMITGFPVTAVTVVDSVNGVFGIPLASALTGTLTPGIYDYDVWRTNAGFESPIVFGPLTVESEQWK